MLLYVYVLCATVTQYCTCAKKASCVANTQSMLCVLHPLKVCNEQYHQYTLITYGGTQSIAQDLHI